MLKRILIAALMWPLLALAQSYPSPTFQNMTVNGTLAVTGAPTFTVPVPVASGGTNAATANGTSLDNITGFASTGFLTRTGAGAYAFQSLTNGITLGNLAQAAANTVLANATAATANVTAFAMPGCSAATNALTWTTSTGFTCNTAVVASNVSGTVAIANGGTNATTATAATSNLQYLQGATGSAARSITNKFQDKLSVLDFSGCDPTGASDSTICIQNAINAAATGQEIDIPPGTYKISSTLTIGNGSSGAASTSNGQGLVGLMAGVAANEWATGAPVIFRWAGAAAGSMLNVNGPIYGVRLSGITFDAASSANTCIGLAHPVASNFTNLLCENYKGPAYTHTAYSEPTGVVVGSSDNVFMNVMAKNPATGGSGILIGASAMGTSKNLDVARNVYIACHWDFDGTTSTTYGIALQFSDNNTFIENTTKRVGGASGVGLFVNPPTGTNGATFPSNMQFYNSPMQGNVSIPGTSVAWNPIDGGIAFWPYPTGDGETVPVGLNPGNVIGITDSGKFFGAAGIAPLYNNSGTITYAPHIVSGSVQLSAGTATVTFSGSAVFTSSATYVCTATDESAANAAKVLMSSGTSISIAGNGTDFVNYVCIGN